MSCDKLFQPITINGLTLKNRVIMGSMHVGLEGLENGLEKLTAFYRLRAKHSVGLIITGGAAVNQEGSGGPDFMTIDKEEDIERWKPLTKEVHEENGLIALQLFHAGRYAYKMLTGMDPVAPSAIQSPINPDKPAALTEIKIWKTIDDFAAGARRAKAAGFDAVEIMGSEGYLINQFVSPVTNHRSDSWGGSFEKRIAFSLRIVEAVRRAVGNDYPVFFRMSGLDFIEGSTTEEETVAWAKALEKAGADALNIGIGWHESRVPTISMKVPRMHFVYIAEHISKHVTIPVIASNRINDPQEAASFLEKETVELVSMARPFLADPQLLTKAKAGRLSEINTCIACNQACLDHVFAGKPATCLVNPEAGRETELLLHPAARKKKVLVIGAGPAGLEVSRVAAQRGHEVLLVDEKPEIGGQLNYSKQVPGKQEFYETLRYYRVQLDLLGVDTHLGNSVDERHPLIDEADEIVIATGMVPRIPDINGDKTSAAVSYQAVFEGTITVEELGKRVAVIGGGGIACDLALFLTSRGVEEVTLLQRGTTFARGIGKTTRWITMMELKKKQVRMIGGIEEYRRLENGKVIYKRDGHEQSVVADAIVFAAGQNVNDALAQRIAAKGKAVRVIGGAKHAHGLDAKKAILDGAIAGREI
ncbi:2,4-dienoyl-CoA reductase (NADPH2) [Evansella caseinilytica]|uniref:2,4-dienoyl-CoA reductase (NADPH2) n=1 Tax=Evansella caseinilytica TaxID=1503961 RepID=A0A1H3UYB5_9BACI|nr:FAD-dependent oxidoreductase [Evansella caseinilytica]SDZ66795.1 2,4-dienoyl-CoA reductase (NADPH2) [Evansella caseinilytica]